MEAGLHLPQMDLGGEGLSMGRLVRAVDAARACGFAAISVNDHFVFGAPWLDGPTVLAAVSDRSGTMDLVTTLALSSLRGPVPLAKALTTLDVLSGGRMIAGLGPGSSRADHDAVGVPFEERWGRFEESFVLTKALLQGGAAPRNATYYAAPRDELSPGPARPGGVPVWLGSWGSDTGLRRVARLGDGWLASAYNTDPERFGAGMAFLAAESAAHGRAPDPFPHAVVTMWTWITNSATDAERVRTEVLAKLLRRDPELLRERVCVGSAQLCADLVSRYAQAGCRRMHFWPVGDEARQVELLSSQVLPRVSPAPS